MTEPCSAAGSDPNVPADQLQPPGKPRWVKIIAAVVGLVVLALLTTLLFGGGGVGHGPRMHDSLVRTSMSVVGTPALYSPAA